MSCKLKRFMLLPVFFLLTQFTLPQAHADTYIFFTFDAHSGAAPVIGIDNAGDVLVYDSLACALNPSMCYTVFQPFGPGYSSATRPAFNGNSGTSCSPNPMAAYGICNNGYEAYFVSTADSNRGVYGGPDTDVQKLGSLAPANSNFLLINSYGDITWTEGTIEENVLAYDVTSHQTPEPATLALLLTGLIPIAAILRRKLIQA